MTEDQAVHHKYAMARALSVFSVATPAEPRGEKKNFFFFVFLFFFSANFGR